MNNMADVLYNLGIYPFEFLIETIYFLFRRNDMGVRIILISVVVNIVSIPIYNVADIWQKKELDLQKYFKPKIDEIKSVFSGDKRQMLIQTFYRINNYHPIYSMRGLLGLFIQVPIFIAAYHFISNLAGLDGRSFGIIKDLSNPDGLINIGSVVINLLPIVMTTFNILSSLIHTRELTNKERVPLFVMAGLFLVLLYNSPSALLVYWTTSNIFSLIKNVLLLFIEKMKKVMKYIAIGLLSIVSILFILVNTKFLYMKPDAVIIISSLFLFSVFIMVIQLFPYDKIFKLDTREEKKLLIISSILLSILLGLFIPVSLMASSPEEFKGVSDLIAITFTRMFSTLFIYPIIAYFIFGEKTKKKIVFIFSFASLYALFNTFLFKGDYGHLSPDLLFNSPEALIPSFSDNIFSSLVCLVLLVLIIIFIKNKKTAILKNVMFISILALVIISTKDLYSISKVKQVAKTETNISTTKEKAKIIDISKDGYNVFIIFMDRAIAYYLPIILENIPSMKNDLEGFVWYKNAVSPSTGTLAGLFPLLGGYDYTPMSVMKNDSESLRNKFNKATLVMPNSFASNGYRTTLVYPPLAGWNWGADISIFKPYSYINAYEKSFNIDSYIEDYVEINNDYLDIYILRFSLFRSMPMKARYSIYNNGNWFSPYERTSLNHGFKEYQYIHELTNVINIISNTNTYTFFGSEMTHEPFYFNSDYKPSIDLRDADKEDLEKYGDNFMAKQLYANTAMLIEITNFVKYLKDNNIYNNTKIIIVSDHGGYVPTNSMFGFESEMFSRSISELNSFNAFLMVKDFNNTASFAIDTNFITTADTASMATSHTKYPVAHSNEIESSELGVYGFIIPGRLSEQNKNTFNVNAIFQIKPNISNWREITNYLEIIKNE